MVFFERLSKSETKVLCWHIKNSFSHLVFRKMGVMEQSLGIRDLQQTCLNVIRNLFCSKKKRIRRKYALKTSFFLYFSAGQHGGSDGKSLIDN